MTQQVERMLPLYEAKMIHQFDHRWATYERDGRVRDVSPVEKADPDFVALPRYWVRDEVVSARLANRWTREWLRGWRDICRSTDERTMIAAVNGAGASPEGGTLLAFPEPHDGAPSILAIWNSFVFDFAARQKVGGTHLKYFTLRQLPVPSPSQLATCPPWDGHVHWSAWISRRVATLILDSSDMNAWAEEMRFLPASDPWDVRVRQRVRAEMDAACFHLYGVRREDVDYIMETFPIVKRKDIAAHGSFRTKELILEIFDAMQLAVDSGQPYVSPLEVSGVLASVAE